MLSSIRYRECVLKDDARYPNLINAGKNYKEFRYSNSDNPKFRFSEEDFDYKYEYNAETEGYIEKQTSNNPKDFTTFQ